MIRSFATNDSTTALVQRAVLGAVMFPHGAQKLLGWYGGAGWDGTLAYFGDVLGVPAPLAILVILAESLGALALIAGLGTRVAAGGIAATMIGAVVLTHLPHGFFMNWFGNQGGEGYEFHLLALALAVPLVVTGGGRWSIDGWLARRLAAGAADQRPSSLAASRA
ncbi:MAG TPA: DoxX family protein [Kofleriaceae bacterium]|jgi:putative oxidoreductase|nr:DoxX family protein [Kofleriaceae bacterium]